MRRRHHELARRVGDDRIERRAVTQQFDFRAWCGLTRDHRCLAAIVNPGDIDTGARSGDSRRSLDGRQIGEAPVKGLSLPLGRHRLKLVNPVQHRQMTLAVQVPAKHAYRVKLP